jgi:hypothetical protein
MEVGTLCWSGENSTWSVDFSLILYLALWWMQNECKGGIGQLTCALKESTEVELSPMVNIISCVY